MSMAQAKRLGNTVSITPEYVESLWHRQKGLCFYTDVPLVVQSGRGSCRESLSFDKIVPQFGYVSGNVVLCTRKANAVKQDLTLDEMRLWLPDWYSRVVVFKELDISS